MIKLAGALCARFFLVMALAQFAFALYAEYAK